MTVRWWRVLAAWPLALVLSVAGTVLALWVTAALEDGSVGAPGDTLYIVLWVALLALPPALVVGVPVLTVTAVALRGTRLVWQVLAVSGVAAWVAAGWTTFLFSPWGPFRTGTVDPAAPYPWENVALHAGIAALAWALGTGAAWAAMQPVRPARAPHGRAPDRHRQVDLREPSPDRSESRPGGTPIMDVMSDGCLRTASDVTR